MSEQALPFKSYFLRAYIFIPAASCGGITKNKVTNLWKYDLPDGWRVIYTTTTPNKVEIISVILEWFNHKEYDRRFSY